MSIGLPVRLQLSLVGSRRDHGFILSGNHSEEPVPLLERMLETDLPGAVPGSGTDQHHVTAEIQKPPLHAEA